MTTAASNGHPVWCNTTYCTGVGEHVSEGFTLGGDAPLVVEIFQGPNDPTPRVSILEQGADGALLVLPVSSVGPLADVLRHVAAGVEGGSPLDPPGTGRPALDDPEGPAVFVTVY